MCISLLGTGMKSLLLQGMVQQDGGRLYHFIKPHPSHHLAQMGFKGRIKKLSEFSGGRRQLFAAFIGKARKKIAHTTLMFA